VRRARFPSRVSAHFIPCRFQYTHSPDTCDFNLLIVLHGNGDNEANFARFTGKMNLPGTAILSVRAPHPLGMQGQIWYPDLGPDMQLPKGDRSRIVPCVEAAELLVQVIRAAEKQWMPHRMFVLGHGQGGVVAVEAASRYEKYLGCVVAAGDCVLDEVVCHFEKPMTEERKQAELLVGDVIKFRGLEVTLVSAASPRPDDDACAEWKYELAVMHADKPGSKTTYSVVCERKDHGNARARGRLINFMEGKFRMRVSGYQVDGVTLSVETMVEAAIEETSKSATRILYTRGERDTIANPKLGADKAELLRRRFRFFDERLYKQRKDVMGTDMAELGDIFSFLLRCQVHQALRYVPPVAGRIKDK
jgi:predicted esterase